MHGNIPGYEDVEERPQLDFAPEGAILEGMDRPDWGTIEEVEAWEWLE